MLLFSLLLTPILGVFASSSIIFSAAYTIYMYQRIAFGGVYSRMFAFSIPDLTKREFTVLLLLVIPTVLFGIYPAAILDAMHYGVSTLIYSFDFNIISCDSPEALGFYFNNTPILIAGMLNPNNVIWLLLAIAVLIGIVLCFNRAWYYKLVKATSNENNPPRSTPCIHRVHDRKKFGGE